MAYDTIREKIMANILGRIALIATSTGYNRDYEYTGEWVLNISEDEIDDYSPGIFLVDDSQEVVGIDRAKTEFVLHLTVAIWGAGQDSQQNIRKSIADVYKCIGEDVTCGGYADDVVPISDTINLVQKDDIYGDAEVKFDIFYACRTWDLETSI